MRFSENRARYSCVGKSLVQRSPGQLTPCSLVLFFCVCSDFLAAHASYIAATTPIPLPEHPRPDFLRERWLNLNGAWQFRFEPTTGGVLTGT